MNNENDVKQTPELKALVERYRDTKAPLGFSERVAAHINDDTRKSGWSNVIAELWGSPKLIAVTSIGLVAVLSIFIVQMTFLTEPETQIAQQDKTTPKTTEAIESTQIAQVTEPTNMDQLLEQSVANDELTNLAVLSDISVWLEEAESTTPDFTDMPDLDEIDSILDIT